jgi:hypothetical protein
MKEKVFKRAKVQKASFAYDYGCEVSTVTFCNITFAYGSVSPKLCVQSLFSSIIP